jgi:hypothetical protein
LKINLSKYNRVLKKPYDEKLQVNNYSDLPMPVLFPEELVSGVNRFQKQISRQQKRRPIH